MAQHDFNDIHLNIGTIQLYLNADTIELVKKFSAQFALNESNEAEEEFRISVRKNSDASVIAENEEIRVQGNIFKPG